MLGLLSVPLGKHLPEFQSIKGDIRYSAKLLPDIRQNQYLVQLLPFYRVEWYSKAVLNLDFLHYFVGSSFKSVLRVLVHTKKKLFERPKQSHICIIYKTFNFPAAVYKSQKTAQATFFLLHLLNAQLDI